METCRLNQFLNVLKPWLDRDYIRKVYLDDLNRMILYFSDGGQNVYQIDDCNKAQLVDILDDIKRRGIPVETQKI